MRRGLHLRWLRLKRQLRSCTENTRALRDPARAMAIQAALPVAALPFRDCLCRPSDRLAA